MVAHLFLELVMDTLKPLAVLAVGVVNQLMAQLLAVVVVELVVLAQLVPHNHQAVFPELTTQDISA
jgi:hypothetical protein